jgi:metallo-beta-lactamase family protein
MQIQFNGAARDVTGSQFLLRVNGHSLLLDCGLYQAEGREGLERNRRFRFDPRRLEAAILSHAHIDHSGNLPNLVKSGFTGPVFATSATAYLADVMLRDSGHIQEADAAYFNKKRLRRGEPPVEPLYTIEDAARVAGQLRPVPYDQAFEPIPGVTAHLVDAGHILGSASVVLDVVEKPDRRLRLWYSADIGRPGLPLVCDPVLPQQANVLIMESTYGDRQHGHLEDAFKQFTEVVKRTIRRGGKVIIPAFAVGRTQELVYALHHMIDEGQIPPIPVYVDSPLAVEATKVFIKSPEYYDEETNAFIRADRHPALNFDSLTYITEVEASKALNEIRESMVIISASGMADTGRILHHLKNNIEDPRNAVVIVSWQAPDSLGRRLVEGKKTVKIFGEEYRVRAEVTAIDGLSAHADAASLEQYALASRDSLQRVILVHGEESQGEALRRRLLDLGIPRVDRPQLGEVIEF